MTNTVREIIESKKNEGADAYLWLQDDCGDCILWSSEECSEDDDGAAAVGRWHLTSDEVGQINALGVVDEHN